MKKTPENNRQPKNETLPNLHLSQQINLKMT